MQPNQPQLWFRTKTFRITLAVVAVIAVAALVLFSKQLSQLFEREPSKAGTTLQADSTNWSEGLGTETWLEGDMAIQDGKLVLVPADQNFGGDTANTTMSLKQARDLITASTDPDVVDMRSKMTTGYLYSATDKAWLFEVVQAGCFPLLQVNIETSEIVTNWRCTGAL